MGVAWAETSGDVGEDDLYDSERAAIQNAVPRRRAEFAAVRHCARRALADLGVPPAPLLRGERGVPVWPMGVVGSMTHCARYRAAAVARSDVVSSLGIDAEPHEPLPDGVLDVVSLPVERTHLRDLRAHDGSVHWDRLLFCAKEAVYKTWFPVMRTWLDFDQAQINFAPQTFVAHVRPGPADPPAVTTLHGRWLVGSGLAFTAIAVPADSSSGLGTSLSAPAG